MPLLTEARTEQGQVGMAGACLPFTLISQLGLVHFFSTWGSCRDLRGCQIRSPARSFFQLCACSPEISAAVASSQYVLLDRIIHIIS